jgi:outer membrane protein, heavy metal efflux system
VAPPSRSSLLLAAAFALSGCSPQAYRPQPLNAEDSAAAFRARSVNDPGLRAFMLANGYSDISWPVRAWGLQELTLLALYFHPDLDIARAQWAEAQAAVVTAARRENPRFELMPEYHSGPYPRFELASLSPWTLHFIFDLTLVTAGKREVRVEHANALSESARLGVGAATWRVRSRVRDRFVAYHAALRQADLMQQEVAARSQVVLLLEHRFEAGAVARSEVTTARLGLGEAQLRLARAQIALATALPGLADAVGLAPQSLLRIELALAELEAPPQPTVPDAPALERIALTNRLDILGALMRYAAAEAALKLEVANQYPDLHLFPGYEWDQGDNRWGLGVGFTLPLPHAYEGPIREAAARRETEAHRFTALQARVIAEVAEALARLHAARREWEEARRLRLTTESRMKEVDERFRAGQADRLDQASARLEAVSARSLELDALIAQQTGLGRLEDALQRPLDPTQTLGVPYQDPRSLRSAP